MVRRDPATRRTEVASVDFETIASKLSVASGKKPVKPEAQRAKLQQALQPHLNEMFFASKVVLVEGLEDVAYITSWLVLSGQSEEFRRHGVHIVPVNGKSHLAEPIIVADCLRIPVFVIFDADGDQTKETPRKLHENDNVILLHLLGGDPLQPFPATPIWTDRFVQWPTNIGDILRAEIGTLDWDKTFGAANKGLGNPEGSYAKNPVHIGDHIELLSKSGLVPQTLIKLCDELSKFAASK